MRVSPILFSSPFYLVWFLISFENVFSCTCLWFGKSKFSLVLPTKLAEMPKDTIQWKIASMWMSWCVGPLRQRARTRSSGSKVVARRCHTQEHTLAHAHTRVLTNTLQIFLFCASLVFLTPPPDALLSRKYTRKWFTVYIGWKNALIVAHVCTLIVR